MTNRTSQGLFIVVAIVIFGIFVGLSYTLFGNTLKPQLVNLFQEATNLEDTIAYTDSKYFEFNSVDGTIISYSEEGPKDVVIPKEINGRKVEKIGSSAFLDKELTSVVFPNTITEIKTSYVVYKGAFTGNNLGKLTIPGNIKIIGDFAFTDAGIEDLVLENGVKKIGSHTFYKNNIPNLELPNSVTNIGIYAFTSVGLNKVTFGENITEIGGWAFSGVNKIKEITIPKSVTIIGQQILSYNQSVEVINMPKELKSNILERNNEVFIKSAVYNQTNNSWDNISYFDESLINYY